MITAIKIWTLIMAIFLGLNVLVGHWKSSHSHNQTPSLKRQIAPKITRAKTRVAYQEAA